MKKTTSMKTIEIATSTPAELELLQSVTGRASAAKAIYSALVCSYVASNKQGVLIVGETFTVAHAVHAEVTKRFKARTFGPVRYTKIDGAPKYFFTIA